MNSFFHLQNVRRLVIVSIIADPSVVHDAMHNIVRLQWRGACEWEMTTVGRPAFVIHGSGSNFF